MKKTLFFSLVALSVLCFTSCNKFEMGNDDDKIITTEETINATINSNETFKFVLPADVNSSDLSISSPQAKSANVNIDNSTGSNNFVYTPDPNFSGTDVITVSQNTPPVKQEGCVRGNDKKQEKKECGTANKGCNNPSNSKNQCNKGKQNKEDRHECKQHKITFNITVKQIIN